MKPAAVVFAGCASPGCLVLAERPWDGQGWSIPGGAVEAGESPAEAAQRELYEETGLAALRLVPVLTARHRGRQVYGFWGGELAGPLHSSDEGEAAWVPIETVLSGPHGQWFARLLSELWLVVPPARPR